MCQIHTTPYLCIDITNYLPQLKEDVPKDISSVVQDIASHKHGCVIWTMIAETQAMNLYESVVS